MKSNGERATTRWWERHRILNRFVTNRSHKGPMAPRWCPDSKVSMESVIVLIGVGAYTLTSEYVGLLLPFKNTKPERESCLLAVEARKCGAGIGTAGSTLLFLHASVSPSGT